MEEEIVLCEATRILFGSEQHQKLLEYLQTLLPLQNATTGIQVIRFPTELDFYECAEHYPTLLSRLFDSPYAVTVAFETLVRSEIEDIYPTLSQRIVPIIHLQVKNFPSLLDNPKAVIISGFPYRTISGVTTGISKVGQYIQSSKFVCKTPECNSDWQHSWIRVFTPWFRSISNQACRCAKCHLVLEEDIQYRVMGTLVLCRIVDPACLRKRFNNPNYYISQSLLLAVRDELISRMELGSTYNVTVLAETRHNFVKSNYPALEVNNVAPNVPYLTTHDLPEKFRELRKRCGESPWSFPLSVAYLLANGASPPGYALQLKLGLLLSLASFKNSMSPLSVVILDSEERTTSNVIQSVAKLADRSIYHSQTDTLGLAESKDILSGKRMTEAGSLVLAAGGVCYMQQLSLWKATNLIELRTILSHNAISAENLHLPLKCAIWVLQRTDNPNQPLINNFKDPVLLSTLSQFGLVLAPVKNTEEDDLAITDHIFDLAAGTNPKIIISDEEFKQYLSLVNNGKIPKLNPDAETLLQQYFIACRRSREDSTTMNRFTLQTLTSIAQAHARLMLSAEATKMDAIAAVWLIETSLKTRTGNFVFTSKLGIKSKGWANKPLDYLIGCGHDEIMYEFERALDNMLQHFVEE